MHTRDRVLVLCKRLPFQTPAIGFVATTTAAAALAT